MTGVLGGRYELGDPVRRTTFGQVHLGRRLADGLPVAVEVLEAGLAADPALRERLLAGAATLRAVSGRHLVPVLHLAVEDDCVAVVRDRVPGTDLVELRAQSGQVLPARTAGALVADVLDGLSDLHAGGVLHGALREADVLVDLGVPLRPVTRLTGFGLAAPVSGRSVLPSDDVRDAGQLLCLLIGAAEPAALPERLRVLVADMTAPEPALRPTAGQARDRLVELAPSLATSVPTSLPAGSAPTAAAGASWSSRAEPTERPVARPAWTAHLVLERWWSRVPLVRALSIGLVLVALIGLVAAVSGQAGRRTVTAEPVASSTVPPYAFPAVLRPDGLRVDRTWTLVGSSLRSETTVRNDTGRTVPAGVDEVVPKSVARDVAALVFAPQPDVVVRRHSVVRYLLRLAPGASTTWRYAAPVAVGTDQRQLQLLARDAVVARLVWEASRPRPPAAGATPTAPAPARGSAEPAPAPRPLATRRAATPQPVPTATPVPRVTPTPSRPPSPSPSSNPTPSRFRPSPTASATPQG